MRKNVVLALAAIALLGVASLAGVYFSSSGAPATDAPASATGAPDAAVALGATAAPPPPQDVAPHPQQALLPEPPQDSWDSAPLILRGRTFGRLGMSLESAVEELRPAVEPCLDEDTQARFGTKSFSSYGGRPAADEPLVATLMLEIETSAGQARILDAPVEVRGTASDGLLSCAQNALRGRTLAVPEASAGGRYRMRFPVRQ